MTVFVGWFLYVLRAVRGFDVIPELSSVRVFWTVPVEVKVSGDQEFSIRWGHNFEQSSKFREELRT